MAADLRRGGLDRIVVPASWSPSIEQLCADEIRGQVYAHEIVSVAPGQAGEYLNTVAHEGDRRLRGVRVLRRRRVLDGDARRQ